MTTNVGLVHGVGHPDIAKVHLRVLTNSELREFRACPRRHHFRYKLRRRPIKRGEALSFGSLLHVGLEWWWKTDGSPADRLEAALAAMQASAGEEDELDAFALVTAEELMYGYTARWGDATLRTVAVEQSFEVPLINPKTGKPSRTFMIGGKVDGIVADELGKLHVLEHKTTTSDIETGSIYWTKVRALDTQVSTYIAGARAAGYAVEDCIYDVIRRPGIRPLKATPEEDRQYTKPKDKACPFCKKKGAPAGPHDVDGVMCADGRVVTDPGGRLYANQREQDETPEEYRLRVRADIIERPERYFARGEIVRLEHDEREHAYDTWQIARMMRDAELAGMSPRNPDACSSFGGCAYLGVCSGEASIDNDALFRTADVAHEELEAAQ